MDSPEFVDWVAYDRLEPIGPTADRRLIATLIALLSNVYRAKGQKAAEPDDFMPGMNAKPAPTQAEVVAKGRAMFGAIAAGQRQRAQRVARRKRAAADAPVVVQPRRVTDARAGQPMPRVID